MFFKKKNKLGFEDVLQDLHLQNFGGKDLLNFKGNRNIESYTLYFVGAFISVIFFVFVGRTFYLQVQNHELYLTKSNNNQFVSTPILPTRGSILDRNGEVLAKSEKTKIDDVSFERIYTKREGFGHLLGYVNYPQKDSSGIFYQSNFEGVSGLEAFYDQILAGKVGKQYYERASNGSVTQSFQVGMPIEGKDVKTSIDAELQEYSYKELRSFVNQHQFQGGTVIIMEIETGQIITMTSYPQFDPKKLVPQYATDTNSYDNSVKNEYLKELQSDSRTPFLNRAIAGTYAPGSTMKPVFALAALQLGLIDEVTSIFSSGRIEIPNSVDPTKVNIFRDWKAHGWVNVRTALANSSDVFFYAVGGGYEDQKGLGINKIDEWSEAFGVDSYTGIDLGGEVVGNIPTPEWKQKVFKEDWRLGDTYTSSIGQFGFLVTPISLLRLTTAIATEGKLITPRIRVDGSKPVIKEVPMEVDDRWYKVVQEGMRMVVTQGTAKNLNSQLFEIAGKSGTAEVGVKKDKIQSWIAGYYPYKEPKYAFVVLCEMGIRDVSPTPNVLARKIFEKMYFMDEYNKVLNPNHQENDENILNGDEVIYTEGSFQ